MAKPRIFVSSTYYDLKYVRAALESFVNHMGYDPILFEKGDITFHDDRSLEISCLQEVDLSHILILIIGGRYGSVSQADEDLAKRNPEKFFGTLKSVTEKEYLRALERNVPVYVFVDAGVLSEFRTYKENVDNTNVRYAHVDDIRIFQLIDSIYSRRNGNYVRGFDNIDEIIEWLRDQWAGLLFDALRQRNSDNRIRNLETQLNELSSIVDSLKTYSEAIVRKIDSEQSESIIAEVNTDLSKDIVRDMESHRFVRHFSSNLSFDDETIGRREILRKIQSSSDLADFLSSINQERDDIDSDGLLYRDYFFVKERLDNIDLSFLGYTFKIGDLVHHKKFGHGSVSNVDGPKISVDFDKVGHKRVLDLFLDRI